MTVDTCGSDPCPHDTVISRVITDNVGRCDDISETVDTDDVIDSGDRGDSGSTADTGDQ